MNEKEEKEKKKNRHDETMPRILPFRFIRSLCARHETRRIIFSAIARKKGITPVNVRRRSIDDVKPISHFSFFLAVGAGPSKADNKRSPGVTRAWFSDGKAWKARYTWATFVKVAQKSPQVTQVRQFRELGEAIPLFLPRTSPALASNKFPSLSRFRDTLDGSFYRFERRWSSFIRKILAGN